jgi:excisionase family DNA binding protein
MVNDAQSKPRNYSIDQACEWAGIARSTFYALMKSGDAPQGFKLGKRRLFPVATLEEWMASLESGKAGA